MSNTRTKFSATIPEMFDRAIALIPAEEIEVIEFLTSRKAQSENKASKPKKIDEARAGYVEAVYNIIDKADKPLTVKEIQSQNSELAEMSNQKISALLRTLREQGRVKRDTIKKVPYYSIGNENDTAEEAEATEE